MEPFQVFSGSRETISSPFSCLVSPHADTSIGAIVQEPTETGNSHFLISPYFLLFDRPWKSCFSHPSLSWPCGCIGRFGSTACSPCLWGGNKFPWAAGKVMSPELLHFPLEGAGAELYQAVHCTSGVSNSSPCSWVTPQEISGQRKAAVLSHCVCPGICSSAQLTLHRFIQINFQFVSVKSKPLMTPGCAIQAVC